MLNTMIVEDSIPFRTVVKNELLSQFPSIEVIEAGSGEEALKRLGSHPVDLAFMDIRLPGQNGLDVTKKIKADYPDTTVAILTSHDSPEYREAAIRCGASCFIGKDSFKWEEIFTLVGCFQKAKLDGRLKPTCVRLERGEI
jgi:DNA-binding NarL/FixJ family response regulator